MYQPMVGGTGKMAAWVLVGLLILAGFFFWAAAQLGFQFPDLTPGDPTPVPVTGDQAPAPGPTATQVAPVTPEAAQTLAADEAELAAQGVHATATALVRIQVEEQAAFQATQTALAEQVAAQANARQATQLALAEARGRMTATAEYRRADLAAQAVRQEQDQLLMRVIVVLAVAVAAGLIILAVGWFAQSTNNSKRKANKAAADRLESERCLAEAQRKLKEARPIVVQEPVTVHRGSNIGNEKTRKPEQGGPTSNLPVAG